LLGVKLAVAKYQTRAVRDPFGNIISGQTLAGGYHRARTSFHLRIAFLAHRNLIPWRHSMRYHSGHGN
jgi:hypothetical protein